MGSLITGFHSVSRCNAAERFEVHFEEMSIPISIKELNDWAINQDENNSELASWLSLLGFESRESLSKFLQTSFVKDKEIILQLLQSWFGRKMFEEIIDIVRLDNKSSGDEIYKYLEEFLQSKNRNTLLDFIGNLPAEVIHIDLDGMVKVANIWRIELKRQQKLVSDLGSLSIKEQKNSKEEILKGRIKAPIVEVMSLSVDHRIDPLPIEIWKSSKGANPRESLIVLMPGFGGDSAHFRWLARSLSLNGWSVLALQHPGSDSKAVKSLLEGKLPAPGLEVIPDRLGDLRAVLNSREKGIIQVPGEKIVLIGHSLGAFTAFLSLGTEPNINLEDLCSKAFDDFSLTNLSELLQCQLVDFTLPMQEEIPDLNAIVGINSFGSLLWSRNSIEKISVPVLLTGGTFDLVTPAISEQLGLFLATKPNPLSRVLLIEGASHFSPIRVKGKTNKKIGDDVFKLNQSFVGVNPLSVQDLLAKEIISFLSNFENNRRQSLGMNLVENDIRYHMLDRTSVKKLLKINNESLDQ